MIALRYVISGQHGSLVAFISRLSMFGLVLGVALLVVVLSVMNGFDRELRERILRVVPQVTLYSLGELRDWRAVANELQAHDQVMAAAPFIAFQGLLSNGAHVDTVLGYGIDPVAEARVSALQDYIVRGDIAALATRNDALALSEILADSLKVDIGDVLMLMVPESVQGGEPVPRVARVEVVAVYATGTEIDNSLALASLQGTAELLGMTGRVEGLRLHIRDLFRAPVLAQQLRSDYYGDFLVGDWTRSYGNLFHAIQLSRRLVGILVFLIIAVAVFNVVATLVLVVGEKRGDVAILRTLGASPRQIMAIFMLQGGLIGLLGAGVGVLLGVLLSLTISDLVEALERLLDVDFLKSDVYPVSYLPADLQMQDVALVGLVALSMSLVATLYPAWRAARLPPAEVLRHE